MTRAGGAIEWAKKHNSPFEYNKLALIDFAHSSKQVTRMQLELSDITIKPTKCTKYLRLMLDQNLRWNEQLAYIQEKGSKWTAQIRRAARPSWGLTPKAARKIFIGVALPRILYGIDVWCIPAHESTESGRKKGSIGAIGKLTTTQRAGALAITGGFRTSPNDALDTHASTLPMHLRIGKALYRAAVRLAALPNSHPLRKQYRLAGSRKWKRHRSSLHYMTQLYGIRTDEVETLPAVRRNPAERHHIPTRIEIPVDKTALKHADRIATDVIKVYTDGSACDGKVGAVAVLTRNGKPDRILRLYMGNVNQHTVYEAEQVGLIMGLHLLATEKKGGKKCAIGLDNQAVINSLQTELTNPGHHLAAEALRLATNLNNKRGKKYSLTIRWTARHSGIKGNEKADKEAKNAVAGQSSDKKLLPKYLRKKLKRSVSALRQANNVERNETWRKEWHASKRFRRFQAKDIVSPSSQKYLALISDRRISRKMASLIFQLRCRHAPLNQYLFRFGKVDSDRCPACGTQPKTVEHFLLQCPKYAHERWPLPKKLNRVLPSTTEILSNEKIILQTLSYIQATERFHSE